MTIKKLCNEYVGQAYIKKDFSRYISDCKHKFEQGTLNKKEIATIRDVVTLTDEYQDAVFYLKVLVRFRQVDEAIKFVNVQLNKETYTKEQKDKMRGLKEQIQVIKKKYVAIEMLKRGEGIEKTAKYSRLPETEVIRLERKFVQNRKPNKKENRKKEENDDGEEPKI